MDFETCHEVGAQRHPALWFTANAAAARHIAGHGFDPSDQRIKALVSEVVLRVLDVAAPPTKRKQDPPAAPQPEYVLVPRLENRAAIDFIGNYLNKHVAKHAWGFLPANLYRDLIEAVAAPQPATLLMERLCVHGYEPCPACEELRAAPQTPAEPLMREAERQLRRCVNAFTKNWAIDWDEPLDIANRIAAHLVAASLSPESERSATNATAQKEKP